MAERETYTFKVHTEFRHNGELVSLHQEIGTCYEPPEYGINASSALGDTLGASAIAICAFDDPDLMMTLAAFVHTVVSRELGGGGAADVFYAIADAYRGWDGTKPFLEVAMGRLVEIQQKPPKP